MVVKSEFEKLGLQTIAVELGEVELEEEISDKQKEVLLENLQILGFDLIDDKKTNGRKNKKPDCRFGSS